MVLLKKRCEKGNSSIFIDLISQIFRLLKKEVNPGNEKQTKPKKHKLIAQAYSKRKKFNSDGHISISFHSSHKDPVGKVPSCDNFVLVKLQALILY